MPEVLLHGFVDHCFADVELLRQQLLQERLRRALCLILRRATSLQVLEIVQTPRTLAQFGIQSIWAALRNLQSRLESVRAKCNNDSYSLVVL